MKELFTRRESRHPKRAAGLLMALVVFGQPLSPAVIVVDGGCSLADAITSANTNSAVGGCTAGDSGPDSIQLTENISLTSALPVVTTDVTLEGGDFEIRRDDATPDFRILEFQGGADARLKNVTISNGRADKGGAIYHDANSLTLVNATLTGNESTGKGGGLYTGWDAFDTRLFSSTVSGNTSGTSGGGIYSGDYGDLILTASTISDNVAGGRGGGIASGNYTSMRLINSTVSGNLSGDEGGGINQGYGYLDVILENSTVIGNGAVGAVGGIFYDTFGPTDLILSNSTIASNSGLNCLKPTPIDLGGNFDSDGSCGAPTVIPGVDFDLALANNGGPTRTHKLLRDSVAIDAGVDCQHPKDQRGFFRDLPCDSGAVEFGKAPVGGSIDGLTGRDVTCRNLGTGASVEFDLDGAESWDCEAEGLAVGIGDRLELTLEARVADGAAGSVIGFSGRNAVCGNLTTGNLVTLSLVSTAAWNCETAGLSISPGDRLQIVLTGSTP